MMDSGSSGSIQSSSGGEEEYHSRVGGNFLLNINPPPPGPVGPGPPTTPNPHSSAALFDPFSNLFDSLPNRSHQNNSPLLNLHTHWPTNPIRLPSTASIPPSSSSSSQLPQSLIMTTTTLPAPNLQAAPAPPAPNTNPTGGRNPRKRTRASRRAPTTVLTTDTSNFRAMVQEFTGIPAPPFTPASSFPRARLDLFGATSSSSPPYLLRPFPQKLSPFPTNIISTTTTTNSLLSPSSDFLLPKQNHPLPSIFNLQPQHPNINLQTPRPEHFLSQNVTLPTTWGNSGGRSEEGPSDQSLFRSMNEATKLNNTNNYSASSSSLDFHGEKRSEKVTTRTEGIIESWIHSSD